MQAYASKVSQTFKTLFYNIYKHDILTLAAALAFYAALSLAPLLLILLSLLNWIGLDTQIELVEQVRYLLGSHASEVIKIVIENADRHSDLGSFAGLLGVMILLFSASAVFGQLQVSLNIIWEAVESSKRSEIWSWLRKRVISMGLVVAFAFLALLSLMGNAAIAIFFQGQGRVLETVNFIGSLLVFALLFSTIFRYLPDTAVSKKEAYVGGLLTAFLFVLGKHAISWYLGASAVGSAYGTAGSIVALLAWVYYSAVIIFLGAEFTRSIEKSRE